MIIKQAGTIAKALPMNVSLAVAEMLEKFLFC